MTGAERQALRQAVDEARRALVAGEKRRGKHGTVTGWRRGCGCERCAQAWRYERARARARARAARELRRKAHAC